MTEVLMSDTRTRERKLLRKLKISPDCRRVGDLRRNFRYQVTVKEEVQALQKRYSFISNGEYNFIVHKRMRIKPIQLFIKTSKHGLLINLLTTLMTLTSCFTKPNHAVILYNRTLEMRDL